MIRSFITRKEVLCEAYYIVSRDSSHKTINMDAFANSYLFYPNTLDGRTMFIYVNSTI